MGFHKFIISVFCIKTHVQSIVTSTKFMYTSHLIILSTLTNREFVVSEQYQIVFKCGHIQLAGIEEEFNGDR